jgi:hypothetical protein
MAENGGISEGYIKEELSGVVGSSIGRIGGRSRGGPRSWTLPESAAGVLIATVATLAVSGLATGVAGALGTGPGSRSTDLGAVLDQATDWADPWVPLLLLAALAVMWREMRRWRARSTQLTPDQNPAPWNGTPATGPSLHVLRMRRLAMGAGVLVVVTAITSVVGFAASLGSLPHAPPAWQVWETVFASGGTTLATLLLCVSGILATLGLLRNRPGLHLTA